MFNALFNRKSAAALGLGLSFLGLSGVMNPAQAGEGSTVVLDGRTCYGQSGDTSTGGGFTVGIAGINIGAHGNRTTSDEVGNIGTAAVRACNALQFMEAGPQARQIYVSAVRSTGSLQEMRSLLQIFEDLLGDQVAPNERTDWRKAREGDNLTLLGDSIGQAFTAFRNVESGMDRVAERAALAAYAAPVVQASSAQTPAPTPSQVSTSDSTVTPAQTSLTGRKDLLMIDTPEGRICGEVAPNTDHSRYITSGWWGQEEGPNSPWVYIAGGSGSNPGNDGTFHPVTCPQ